MKKLLLLLAVGIYTSGIVAQDLDIVDPVSIVTGSLSVPEDVELDAHWDVVNMGSDTMKVRARRIQDFVVPGSQNRFCWGPLCYDYPTNESSTNPNLLVTMYPGVAESTFHGYYEHQGNAGHAIIQYCFFDAFDSENETCTTVHFCVDDECIVGIENMDTSPELGNISPNPVTGLASFTYSFTSIPYNASVAVYNLVGKKVREVSLENKNGIVFINASDFEPGVYFYTLEGSGKVFATKKLVISR